MNLVSTEKIARSLTTTRREFDSILLRAQDNVAISKDNRYLFEALTQQAEDWKAFKEVLEFSKSIKDLYSEIIRLVCLYGFSSMKIEDILDEKKKAELQAMSAKARGLIETEDLGFGTLTSRRWTGKVIIAGEAKGTGILIGPRRFLTAWHVVEEMYVPVPGSNPRKYLPKQDPPAMQIIFDDFVTGPVGRRIPPRPLTVEVDKNFNEVFSNCHVDELQQMIPDPTTELDGYWDYAVITLEKPMETERSYARLDKRVVVPDEKGSIVLIQHPDGRTLKADISSITYPKPADKAIPEIRFLHQSNTLGGSSGCPCFDKEFFLVGLHQGVWKEQVNGMVTNRGVPIRKIIDDIEKQQQAAEATGMRIGPNPDDYFAWYTDPKTFDPIIGLDDFQELVQVTIENFKQRSSTALTSGNIWSLQGDVGSGKSFCIEALFSMLSDTEHMKIRLPGETIAKKNCVDLAKFICSEAGAELKGLVSFKKYNTTLAAWLKGEVTQKVLLALDSKRSNRMTWICISNLNLYDITGKNTSAFLFFLYECVLQNPWLQIVIDGLKTELPSNLLSATLVYNTHSKTRDEIRQYLIRFLSHGPFEELDPQMIEKFTDKLFRPYEARLRTNEKEAMKLLFYQSIALLFQFNDMMKI